MKNFLILSLLTLACVQMLSSCSEDSLTPPTNEVSKSLFDIITSRGGSMVTTDGDITVVAIDYLYGGNSSLDNLDISGYFKNGSGVVSSVSGFNVGSYSIPEQSNFRYTLNKNSTTPADNISQVNSALCGQEINYVVTSTAFGNVSTSLHMPTTLNTTIASSSSTTINRSASLQINWLPDPYVGDGVDDELVGVAVVYHAGIPFNQEQVGMPTQNITIYKQANDTSGTVTFSPSDLSVFPINSYVTIYCGRAHQKIVTSSAGRTVAITNLMMTTTLDMKVQ